MKKTCEFLVSFCTPSRKKKKIGLTLELKLIVLFSLEALKNILMEVLRGQQLHVS